MPLVPAGINDKRQVVGQFQDAPAGFLYDSGKCTTIAFPGALSTMPTGINNDGEVIGGYTLDGIVSLAFIYKDGAYTSEVETDPDTGTPLSTFFTAISNAGHVAGWGQFGFFIYSNSVFNHMTSVAIASGINDHDDVLGLGSLTGAEWITGSGQVNFAQVPGAGQVFSAGINDDETILLHSKMLTGDFIDYFYNSGTLTQITYPSTIDSQSVSLNGLNNSLDFVGFDGDAQAGFLATATPLTPVTPEQSALSFVPITPCRVVDTRNQNGPFGGPELGAGASREFDIPQGACSIPSSASAYSLNVTVVPNASLGYLTLWPSGQSQPLVSTLNSDGRVKANAAIVPAGSSGGVSIFASDPTHVILDINGYFVPTGTASALQFYPVNPCRIADNPP